MTGRREARARVEQRPAASGQNAFDATRFSRRSPADRLFATLNLVRRLPFTIVLVTVLGTIGALSATVWRDDHLQIKRSVGVDLHVLAHVRIDHLLLSPFYQSSVGIDWRMLLAIALIVGALEYIVGSLRAAVTFVASDIATSIAAVLLLAAMGAGGWQYAHTAARTADSGASVGMLACSGALAVLLPARLRPIAFVVLAAYVLPAFLWWSYATWIEHLIGSAIGIAFGALFLRRAAERGGAARDLARRRSWFRGRRA